jgi:hypothetical protein
MKAFVLTNILVCIPMCAFSTPSNQLKDESRLLGYCEFVYMYAAQYLQMQNNEGAAKAYLNRSSMMTIAFFISEEDNGVISSAKIKASREPTLIKKKGFDKKPETIFPEVGFCDREAIAVATRIRNSGKKLWGKSFDELKSEMFAKSRENLGIN